jgi:ribosome-associated protein
VSGPPPEGRLPLPGGRSFPRSLIRFHAARSGGPGGQHVNTSATKVELRLDPSALPLTPAEWHTLRGRLANRLDGDGAIVVTASSRRSQAQNRAEAEERLVRLLHHALAPPRARVPTSVPRAERRRRRRDKEARASTKALRRRPADGSD